MARGQKLTGPEKYRRRIASYLRRHPGATRQQARGQKPREKARTAQRQEDRGKGTATDRLYFRRLREAGAPADSFIAYQNMIYRGDTAAKAAERKAFYSGRAERRQIARQNFYNEYGEWPDYDLPEYDVEDRYVS